MKKSIKSAFFLGALFLNSAFLTAPAGAETAGTLPAFLPKNYKLVDVIKGNWQGDSAALGKKLSLVAGLRIISFQEDDLDTIWERKQKKGQKSKTKILGSVVLQGEPSFTRQAPLKLWFANGHSINILYDKSLAEDISWADYVGQAPWNEKNDDSFEPTVSYAAAENLAHSKPVALTQGQNVLLLESFDETALKEYQNFLQKKE